MCIVAIAWQCFEELPVLLLSNRDEYCDRPTLPLHLWEGEEILAGKDIKSGGTWLGCNPKNGKWATVLNVRDSSQYIPPTDVRISRGKLVTDYLQSDLTARQYAKQITLNSYEGFNFVCGDRKQAFIISNRGQELQSLSSGVHVFSNGAMTGSNSNWFKCEKLNLRVMQEVMPLVQHQLAMHPYNDVCSPNLNSWQQVAFHCLQDTTKADIDKVHETGFPLEYEHALSSIFIEKSAFKGKYGTRQSSLMCITHTGYDFKNNNGMYFYHE